jgi:TolB-like protein/Tfp pilus assembly protein PilF
MASVWGELKRRNVVKVAIAYAIVGWLLVEIASVLSPALRLPAWTISFVVFLLILGFPVALILSWAYELTPDGIERTKSVPLSESITKVTGRKLDFVIIGLLVGALGFFAYDKYVLTASQEMAKEEAVTEEASVQPVAAEVSDKSIAVLPFVNMSDDPGNEYFSDGISEEILNLLAKVPELRVISRSSAFSFKGRNLDVPTMAARLNVEHVLEGSVRKSGNQLRITAQLIEVVSDTHLWSETFDRELRSVFAIQDEIAAAVVDALKITLLGKELKATETSPEAYALYLQGRHFFNQGTAESSRQAETRLKQALEIDPGFAPAWTELGNIYRDRADYFGIRSFDEGSELAHDAIQQALAIDPQNGRAYAVLASVEFYFDWDFTTAFQHQQQALALDPGDALILVVAADIHSDLGRFDEAIDLHRQSIVLDPVSYVGHRNLGWTLYFAHRLEEAANSLQIAISLSPGGILSHYLLGNVLLAQGDTPAALVAMEQETSDAFRLAGRAIVQHALGDAGASDAALQALIEKHAAFGASQIAEVYAFRGGVDNAFEWLEQAYDNRDSGLPVILGNPLFANLHSDPRWEAFLAKMGFQQ